MVKFERIAVFSHVDQRNLKIERFADDALEFLAFDVASEERVCHDIGYVGKAHLGDVVEKRLREQSYSLRHEQTLVRSKTVHDSFLQSRHRSIARCAVVFDMLAHEFILKIRG